MKINNILRKPIRFLPKPKTCLLLLHIIPNIAFIMKPIIYLILFLPLSLCGQSSPIPAAWQLTSYLPLLSGKRIAVAANQTSLIGNVHLVDTLLSLHVNIQKIFCPEHGFRGTADAGETIMNETDSRTGIPIISLYGKKLKPTRKDLTGIDIFLFDIQDVGTRFYTYISTLHYVMESCAENDILLVVLDRPNPNGNYIDGPALDTSFRSFVGMHPVPVVYGMTIGEYALMINGEKWLKKNMQCNIKVIPCDYYSHKSVYQLPVRPSPNLPDMRSVYLYPTLCLFEGTMMSVGRGTPWPFQVIGHPLYPDTAFSFVPATIPGTAKNPLFEGQICYGLNLRNTDTTEVWKPRQINIDILISVYNKMGKNPGFFNAFFDKLAGTNQLRTQIVNGKSESEIRKSWEKDLQKFRETRKKYLLYDDF